MLIDDFNNLVNNTNILANKINIYSEVWSLLPANIKTVIKNQTVTILQQQKDAIDGIITQINNL